MAKLTLTAGTEKAPYILQEGALGEIANVVGEVLGGRRAFVVTDEHVGPLYGGSVAEQLDAPILDLPAGEEHKRWSSVERIVAWMVGLGVERGDFVIAVGGGVVTDIAGFAASVALRGIPWIAVPTTLLGMVDAAVGGKTGIDLASGKNLVGTFWPPRAVIADPLALTTLDRRHLRAGAAEIVKMGMIAPSSLDHVLDAHLADVIAGRLLHAGDLIMPTVRAKADIVAVDEREAGPRASLNLGHTLGHALEAATDYARLLHGEAVAWGLLAALRLARDRGLLATTEALAWSRRIDGLAPLPTVADISWEDLVRLIGHDKKRAQGAIGWVMPRLGGVVLGVQLADREVQEVFSALKNLPPAGPFSSLF